MKRNDIVICKNDDYWRPYGRIWKKGVGDHFIIINCMREVLAIKEKDLEVNNEYDGFWGTSGNGCSTERFQRMPSLRRLKQMASKRNKGIWRK